MKHQLNIGDKITSFSIGSTPVRIYEVTRVTQTMAFCKLKNALGTGEYELKFEREVYDNFHEKGDRSWTKTWYRITTPEHLVLINEAKLRRTLEKTNWKDVPASKIEKILAILNDSPVEVEVTQTL